MSCGWAPASANETSAPRSAAVAARARVSPGTRTGPRECLGDERLLVGANLTRFPTARIQIRLRRPSPIASAICEVPGLELPRQVGPRRLVRRDRADHVPATDERRHLLEQRRAARAGRRCRSARTPCDRSMRRSRRPIRQAHGHLRDRLGAVDHDHRAGVVGAPGDLGHRVDRAEHVRDVHDRDQPRAPREQRSSASRSSRPSSTTRHVRELGLRAPGTAAATGRCSSGAPSR